MIWAKFKDKWEYFIQPNGFVQIRCPLMHSGTEEFSEHRAIYKEFKELTNMIEINSYPGWVSDTKITLPVVMRMFQRVGAKPYSMDGNDTIWFMTDFRR
jgi:hypothetical protein